jgi:hypothetical protein
MNGCVLDALRWGQSTSNTDGGAEEGFWTGMNDGMVDLIDELMRDDGGEEKK